MTVDKIDHRTLIYIVSIINFSLTRTEQKTIGTLSPVDVTLIFFSFFQICITHIHVHTQLQLHREQELARQEEEEKEKREREEARAARPKGRRRRKKQDQEEGEEAKQTFYQEHRTAVQRLLVAMATAALLGCFVVWVLAQ